MKLKFSREWLDRASREDRGDLLISGPCSQMDEGSFSFGTLASQFSKSPAATEMLRRGWVAYSSKNNRASVITDWFESWATKPMATSAGMFRGTISLPSLDVNAQLASYAWLMRTTDVARKQIVGEFSVEKITEKEISKLTSLSALNDGPRRVKNWMKRLGIYFVIESPLPGMRIDGAVSMLTDGKPMIALSLRYDRLDSFWFTVLHEVAHIKRHLSDKGEVFFDDLDAARVEDEQEAEADAFARDAFIPRDIWRRSDAYRLKKKPAIFKLAESQKISPAVVAGRLRYETGDYSIFSDLVGQGVIRNMLIDMGD